MALTVSASCNDSPTFLSLFQSKNEPEGSEG
jgi:hypothetical protein